MLTPFLASGFTHRAFVSFWNNALIGLAVVEENGRFVAANPAFCAITEYAEAELQTMRYQDITDPRDVEGDVEMARRVANNEDERYTMKKRYITKTGKIVWVVLRVVPVEKSSGAFEYFLAQISTLIELEPSKLPVDYPGDALPPLGKILWIKLKDNWQLLAILSGAIAYLMAETVKVIKGGP